MLADRAPLRSPYLRGRGCLPTDIVWLYPVPWPGTLPCMNVRESAERVSLEGPTGRATVAQDGKAAAFRSLDSDGLNGGVSPEMVMGLPRTPTDHLFTRSHAPPPGIDPGSWRLEITGLVRRPVSLSLDDLRTRFPARDVVMTMVCAGLRRRELLSVAALPGELPWGLEPVGTSGWRGVSLATLLDHCEVDRAACHVEAIGLDEVRRGEAPPFGFGASIPIEKAREPDVLVAWELDGKPLPLAHGFPVRLIVPGWIGARSVKWLGRIVLREDPSPNYFQTRAYRLQRTVHSDDPRDVTAGEVIEAVALNSVITSPVEGSEVPAGAVPVTGWAIGPEGAPAARVELSADGGSTWAPVTLAESGERWTWRLWNAPVTLRPGRHELVVRAWDQEGRCQPASLRETWNAKGYANNAWHRVTVEVRRSLKFEV